MQDKTNTTDAAKRRALNQDAVVGYTFDHSAAHGKPYVLSERRAISTKVLGSLCAGSAFLANANTLARLC